MPYKIYKNQSNGASARAKPGQMSALGRTKGAQQQPGESNENKRGAKTVTVNGIPALSVRDVRVLSKLSKLISFMTHPKGGSVDLE